jgi:hypothetical protein
MSRPFPCMAISSGNHLPSHILRHCMAAVARAFFGYFFLVLIVRIVGRRPGKQMTPFEFVLIFFIGGLALTAIVGDEVSFTNGICQAITHLPGPGRGLRAWLGWWMEPPSSFSKTRLGVPILSGICGYTMTM